MNTLFALSSPNTGVSPYICALHDELGIVGKVTVSL